MHTLKLIRQTYSKANWDADKTIHEAKNVKLSQVAIAIAECL